MPASSGGVPQNPGSHDRMTNSVAWAWSCRTGAVRACEAMIRQHGHFQDCPYDGDSLRVAGHSQVSGTEIRKSLITAHRQAEPRDGQVARSEAGRSLAPASHDWRACRPICPARHARSRPGRLLHQLAQRQLERSGQAGCHRHQPRPKPAVGASPPSLRLPLALSTSAAGALVCRINQLFR